MQVSRNIVSENADFGANYASPVIPGGRFAFGSIQIQWDGAPMGTLEIKARNAQDLDFIALDSLAIAGAPGSHLFNLQSLNSTDYQITYTSTSGSGTAKIISVFKTEDK